MLRVLAAAALARCWAAARPAGTAPEDAARYGAPAGFRCFDGSAEVPSAAVNDDFCDCADGSDEPGTAACAGLPAGRFYCRNAASAPRLLYASRVGDGICDCCDGSDEADSHWGRVPCPNTCEAEGARLRAGREAALAAVREGLRLRREAEQRAEADIATWRAEKEMLDREVADLERAQAEARERQGSLQAPDASGEPAAEAGDVTAVAPANSNSLQPQAARPEQLLFAEDFEAAGAMEQWSQAEPGSAYVAPDPEGQHGKVLVLGHCTSEGGGFSLPAFSCSTARRCRISFWARGAPWQGFNRAWAHSWLAVPEAYTDGLRNRLISTRSADSWVHYEYDFPTQDDFQTFGSAELTFASSPVHIMVQAHASTGSCETTMFDDFKVWQREPDPLGHRAAERPSPAAEQRPEVSEYARWALGERGEQQRALALAPAGTASNAAAEGAPGLGPGRAPGSAGYRAAKSQPVIDEAAKALRQAKGRRFGLEVKLRQLEEGGAGARWAALVDGCLEQRFRQQGYRICYFGTAKQGSVSLGSFQGWEPGGAPALLFDRGQRCQAGPARRLRLRLLCGAREELLDLREPSWCSYEAEASHPSACEPEDLRQAEAQAEGAVLLPHEEL